MFEYPILSSHLQARGIPFKCMETDAEFKPYAITLERREVKLVCRKSVAIVTL